MGSELLGDDFKLYYDANSNYSTPSWTEIKSVGDLGFDPASEMVEIPKRIGTKVYKPGRGDWELSCSPNYNGNNAAHVAIRNAIENKTRIHMAVADGNIATNGTHYWHAWWALSGNLDMSLDNPAAWDITGKPHHDMGTSDTEIPAAATVGG